MRESLKLINRGTLGTQRKLLGVEVGVRAGVNALTMLQSMQIGQLYLVDHYQPHTEHSGNVITKEQQDQFFNSLIAKIQPFLDKTTVILLDSVEASKKFQDNYFDFVYLDGGHSYEQVQNDMKAWFPKVKKSGILCGHDYNNKCTPDVTRAVKDYAKANNLALTVMDDLDWMIIV